MENNNFNQNQYQSNETNNFNQELNNQVLEKKEGSNKTLIGVLVMSFIAIIVLAYLYTDLNNEYVELKGNQINNPTSCVKPNKKEIKVEELTHIVTKKDENGKQYADIKVPKITGDTDNINSLNKRILEDSYEPILSRHDNYELELENWINEDPENPGLFYKGEYRYVIKNNVIILVTTIHNFQWEGYGEKIYTYDIDSDKEIKLSDALIKMGYTDANFQNMANEGQCCELTNDGMDEDRIPCTIDMVKKELDLAHQGKGRTEIYINELHDISVIINRCKYIK